MPISNYFQAKSKRTSQGNIVSYFLKEWQNALKESKLTN